MQIALCDDENAKKKHFEVTKRAGAQVIQNPTTGGPWSIEEFFVLQRAEKHFSSTFKAKKKQIQLPRMAHLMIAK